LQNMRDQVIDTVGQVSDVLPRWQLSRQPDGTVLGYIPAWVIAYTKPGESQRVAYNILTEFGERLNLVDFEVDRYELDRFLTKNWDPVTDDWTPSPPTYTRFDGIYSNTATVSQWGNYNIDYTVFTPTFWTNNSSEQIEWTNNWDGQPTVFDGNSLQFIDPVDMYANTLSEAQIYDKYLVFPKRNILE